MNDNWSDEKWADEADRIAKKIKNDEDNSDLVEQNTSTETDKIVNDEDNSTGILPDLENKGKEKKLALPLYKTDPKAYKLDLKRRKKEAMEKRRLQKSKRKKR